MARVYLNDSEAEIREKLNLQAEEINEDFAELQVWLSLSPIKCD